jgi:hypothetical protein
MFRHPEPGYAGIMALPLILAPVSGKPSPALTFLKDILQVLSGRVESLTPASLNLDVIQEWLDDRWLEFIRFHPGPWMLLEGCAVAGLKARIQHKDLLLNWNTFFRPQPRHGALRLDDIALGFFGTYDLYATCPAEERPNMVARWGSGYQEAKWKLGDEDSFPPPEHMDALREAFRRVNIVNGLAGTPWVNPAPGGTLGVPLHEHTMPEWSATPSYAVPQFAATPPAAENSP